MSSQHGMGSVKLMSLLERIRAQSQMVDDPQRFYPDRFLQEDSEITNPSEYMFGFGRRYVIVSSENASDVWVFISGKNLARALVVTWQNISYSF